MTPLINLNKVTVLKICGISIIVFSCIFAMASQPIVLVDDAWITFRYAHNLAYNGQLTFNLNERVEGITNALWAIILAFQIRLIPISIVIIAIFNSLLFTAFSLYRIWKIGVFLKINPVLAALPPSILILSRDFYGTVTNGLEAALFTFLLVESIYWFLQGKRQISSLAFGLLFLTRPDTLVLGFIFIGVLLQPSIRLVDGLRLTLNIFNFQTKENRFEIAQCVAIFLGIVVAATGSRLWYYHDFIPNSVRAKFVVYDLSLYKAGLEYVMNFIKDNPHFIFILIGVVGFLFVKVGISFFRTRSCQLSLSNLLYQLIAFCFISILWSFAVVMRGGGDWMSNYRLLAQYSILYIVLLVVLLKEISPYNKLSSSVLLVLLIVSFAQTSMLFTARMKSDTPLASIYYVPSFPFLDETARRLSRSPLVPSDVISAEGIGYISYTLIDTYMHDPLGLTEKYIARYGKSSSPFGKKDIKYTVLKVRPSVMVWHYAGHLQNLDLTILDDEYVTYCLAYCNDWHDADIVMIRKDRAKDLSPYFDGWKKISIKMLFEGDQ